MTQKSRWRRDGALFELLATSGIRPEEVPLLAVSAFDANGRLFIPSRKSDAEFRQVDLPQRALRAIGTWIDLRAPIDPTVSERSDPLFVGISRHGHYTNKALTSDGMRRILNGIATNAGLDPSILRPRDLQRYALTQLADQEPTTIKQTSRGQPIETPHTTS